MKTQTELLYEAYNSVYLTEEDQYCYDIAEFLVSEGFSEEEIYALTEEENFFEIVEYIAETKQLELLKKTKDGYAARSMTPSAIRKQKGVPVEGRRKQEEPSPKKSEPSPGQLSLNLTGKKPSRSLPSTRRPGPEERRVRGGGSRKGSISRNERNREYPGNTSSKSARDSRRLKELESEVERDWPSIKKQQEFQMPPKTAVRQAKDYVATRAQQDIQKLRKAGQIVGALASGAMARFTAGEKVKGQRVAKGRTVTPEVEKRYKRKEGYRAIKKALGEDYFDIVADYLLENFEFESEEHLLQTMTYLDEEVIDDILMEVKGLGGEVDPDSGEYTGRRSRAQRYRRLAGTEGARSRTYSSGSVTSGGRLSKPNSTSTMVGAGKGQGSSRHPEMKKSPLEKAKNKYDELRGRGENKRANKIAKFLERGGNRYD